ncbi:MAG: guanylate kinase [Lachnospiraceae bacterium]|nr:guanylate kinase [Lachnospiraceae bacterium]
MKHNQGLVIVLSGFSGAGKGTIMKHLLDRYPGSYHLSISATTRPMRTGERDGREYFFKSREEFDRMIADGEFLEYATFNGNSYGTPKTYVEQLTAEGKDVILEIEVQGALQVRQIFPEALLLFVTPPSADELKRRLVGRGTESAEVIAQRLAISAKESVLMPKYDYLIINDVLDEAVAEVHRIIQSEHYATGRNAKAIADMQEQLKQFV